MHTISRAVLMFEADIDVEPFIHKGIRVCRLHVFASASREPGFWWAEGVGQDMTGAPVNAYALEAEDLPASVLRVIDLAYQGACSDVPVSITDAA